jgi:hypothetical protein
MQRIMLTALFLTVAALSIACAAQRLEQNVTVAELVRVPQNFNGKFVRVRACAITSMHATLLFDCSAPGNSGVVLFVPENSHSADTETLLTESFGPEAASGQRHVSATILGQFQWRPNEHPNAILTAKAVFDLAVDEP